MAKKFTKTLRRQLKRRERRREAREERNESTIAYFNRHPEIPRPERSPFSIERQNKKDKAKGKDLGAQAIVENEVPVPTDIFDASSEVGEVVHERGSVT